MKRRPSLFFWSADCNSYISWQVESYIIMYFFSSAHIQYLVCDEKYGTFVANYRNSDSLKEGKKTPLDIEDRFMSQSLGSIIT